MSAIGVTLIDDGRISDSFGTLINPETYFSPFNIALTGITPEKANRAMPFPAVWEKLKPMFADRIIVAHNAIFDLSVLSKCLQAYCISYASEIPYLCTVRMGRKLLTRLPNHKLDTLSAYYGISLDHHRADSDANACAQILLRYLQSGAHPMDHLRIYDLDRRKTLSLQEQRAYLETFYSSSSLPR